METTKKQEYCYPQFEEVAISTAYSIMAESGRAGDDMDPGDSYDF